MCRWLAYSGSPILLSRALYTPAHSLIDQSLHSTMGAEPTDGDGFGIGWYDAMPEPGVFHSIEPAWNDQNLRELAGHITSGHFFAHIRAAIGSAVQQTNCHPFRHEGWLFMHNGFVAELFRYSSEGKSRSLFFTKDVGTRRHLYPEREILHEVSADARLVVSEPMGDLPGAWNEVPESSCVVVGRGEDRLQPFEVKSPTMVALTV
jgi:glutamine amidotransferase